MKRKNLLEELGISNNTFIQAKKKLMTPREELGGKALINVYERYKDEKTRLPDLYTIVNIWDVNLKHFKDKYHKPDKNQNNIKYIQKLQHDTFNNSTTCMQKSKRIEQEPKEQEQKEQQQQHKIDSRTSANQPSQASVVVFSCFDKLNLSSEEKRMLSKSISEEKAEKLVKRVLSWTGRSSDIIACRTILNQWDTWADPVDKQTLQEDNHQWAKNKLQPSYSSSKVKGSHVFCDVLTNSVEIGIAPFQPTIISYESIEFKEEIKRTFHKYGVSQEELND
ncbi:MAG: hypothetical protein R3230_01300 [Nitrosopumilaceae archaeon]|nr:hypothetical protein [Nitrosopumilaceae archaeon]